MNRDEKTKLTIRIPIIKADSEAQTSGQLVVHTPYKEQQEKGENKEEQKHKTKEDKEEYEMEVSETSQSLRKRRNISKNRGQATRQREKTPEPGRMGVPHDDSTSDEEGANNKPRSNREIEAEDNYKEMMRLVQEKTAAKDPDDLDFDEINKARSFAEHERRRRSISPFALPDKEELVNLQRKGSFVDPGNKLLSTTYTLSPKEEDAERRNSLTLESSLIRKNSLSPSSPKGGSPREGVVFPYPSPPSPRKQREMSNSGEDEKKSQHGRTVLTPIKRDENVFTFNEETKPKSTKSPVAQKKEQSPGGLVTKIITVERSPSRKLASEMKPAVEVRSTVTVERTPSIKLNTETKSAVVRRTSIKPSREGTQEPPTRPPPVKPARSKSASRFGGKTSESEMSEDQSKFAREDAPVPAKRKTIATPRRFIRNKSPRGKRSQSVTRVEDLTDKTGTGMTQTSKEIIQLLEQARARSLSIPKDDPEVSLPYIHHSINRRTLVTPNKSPMSSRRTRGISCPKTIQLISSTEVLAGLTKAQKLEIEFEKQRKSRYIDASQSEYTSSCYSSSPSENEYDFNLVNKTAELNRKLSLLSQEIELRDGILLNGDVPDINSILRKRSVAGKQFNSEIKQKAKQERQRTTALRELSNEEIKVKDTVDHLEPPSLKYMYPKFRRKWRQFISDYKKEYQTLIWLFNRCVCDLIFLVIFCGIGGLIFKNLEGTFESAYKCGSRNVKRDFIENLWKGSHYLKEEDWKTMARNKLHEFEDQLHTAHEAGVTSHSGLRSWNFMNSFVYCLTIVTTIGYGHIVPSTFYGRVATIVYAVFGIPLFLIVLADFGKLFTRIIKFFWAFIRRLYFTGSCKKVRKTVPMQEMMRGLNMVYDVVRRPSHMLFEEDLNAVTKPSQDQGDTNPDPVLPKRQDTTESPPPPLPPKPGQQPTWVVGGPDIEAATPPETPAPSVFEIDDEFNLPISVAITILILYILVGAVIYMCWEEWTFFQSFYFVFISMSTIGFGDLVPGHPIYMMTSIVYLVFGLALTSMCINVVQVKLSDTFKQASAKIGATIGLRVADEDGGLVPIVPVGDLAPVHRPRPKEAHPSSKNEVDPEIETAMKSE